MAFYMGLMGMKKMHRQQERCVCSSLISWNSEAIIV